MLYSIISVAIIVISILCFLILVLDFNGLISNYFLKGKTILKVIKIVTPFLCILFLFTLGSYYHHSMKISVPKNEIAIEIYNILCYTIKSLVFEVNSEKILILINENSLYHCAWCIAYPLCVITSYVNILNIISHRIVNKFRVRITLRKSCDILIGTNFADVYRQTNNKNVILWVDDEITKERELELIKLGIPYINKRFNVKRLQSLPFLKRSIRRRKKNLQKEIKYYLKNTSIFVNDFIEETKNVIKEAKNMDKVNMDILNKVLKRVDMIDKVLDGQLSYSIEKLRNLENIEEIKLIIEEFNSYFADKTKNNNLINVIKNIYFEVLKSKDLNEMIMKNETMYSSNKYLILKELSKKISFETKEIDYHFISFNDEETNLNYLSEFKQFLRITKKKVELYKTRNYFLHIELTNNNILSIQNKIQEDSKDLSPFLLFFNRYQLLAIKFNEENPITKYLPNSFVNEFGAITNPNLSVKYEFTLNENLSVKTNYEKNINVIYLGFGKVSKELHKLSVMNNQIVSYCTDDKVSSVNRYHNHVINYFAIDKETLNTSDKNNLYFSNRFNNIKENLIKENYYTFPEETSKFYSINNDINNIDTYNTLINLLKYRNDNTFTQIVVSLDSDLENIDYALKVLMLLQQEHIINYHLFVRLKKDNKGVNELLKAENVSFFGYYSDIFTHDIIVKDNLMKLAKLTNRSYNKIKLINTEWYNLTPIDQKSNLYASLNIRLKLNLIGFDYEKISEKEYKNLSTEIIESHKANIIELSNKLDKPYKNYNEYLFFKNDNIPSISNILSFQEHSRWNSFYLGYGYIPMAKTDVKIKNGVVVKSDDILKQHICLTTYQDLDLWHNFLASLLTQINRKKESENLINRQTYRYDYMLIEQFESLFNDLENNLLLLKKLNK